MLFRKSYRPRSKLLETGDLADFAEFLGIPVESLEVHGSQALKEATVYTCLKILSESVAKLPMKIYQDNGEGAKKPIKDYRYSLLKLRPNPYMSAYDFWRVLEVNRNIYGNSYALIDDAIGTTTGNGKIAGLYPAKSENMTIYVDNAGLLSGKDKVWYQYRDDTGKETLLNSDAVLHFKGLSLNGLVGLSTIEQLKMTIENAKSSSEYLNTSYKKGLQVGGILQYTGDLSDSAQAKLVNKYELSMSGVKNSNRITAMPVGLTYQPINLKMTDAQFLENTQLTIQQLTAAFGIKPHQVNDQTKTSYASTSEANREFYSDTMLAILTMYEQECTYKLFTKKEIENGFYVKFNADVILRGDPEKRYTAYRQAVQNMILTPNECRRLEERPEKPGGDKLYGNASLVPAELLAEGLPYKQKLKGGETGE